jgi:hypothetical protein
MPEHISGGRIISSPQWWIDYLKHPYKCTHKDNEKEECTYRDCPKQSLSYSFPMAWWRNKETCNHKEGPHR